MVITSVILMAIATTASDASRESSSSVLPGEVREALEKNTKSLFNLMISGTKSQRMLEPGETVLKTFDSRETEAEFTAQVRFELRFQGGRYRETLRHPRSRFYSGNDVRENSFDGKKFYYGACDPLMKLDPGVLIVTTPKLSEEESKSLQTIAHWCRSYLWYLFEAGFSGSTEEEGMGQPVQSLVLARAAAGEVTSVKEVGKKGEKLLEITLEYPEPWHSKRTHTIEKDPGLLALLNGTDKLQMRVERERRQLVNQKRLCRFVLDGNMGYAVREKWEQRKESGEVMFHTKNSDFVQVEPEGAWLPRHCDVESYAYWTTPLYTSPRPLYETNIQVEKFERKNFAENDFQLWYDTPGLLVQDYTNPKSTVKEPFMYRLMSSTDALESLADGSFVSKKRTGFILLNVLMATVFGISLYLRSRRKTQQAT